MRRRRIAFLAVLGLVGIAALFVFVTERRIAAWNQELEHLQQTSIASNRDAQALLSSGLYDLRISISRAFLETLFTELKGFQSVTRRGNEITIRKVAADFRDGFLRLDAEVDLDSRFFKGPVEASYLAFTSFREDGTCRLEFRVAEASPKGDWFLGRYWIEPWIVYKLQSRLKLPELELPLSLAREVKVPRVEKKVSRFEIDVTVPQREIRLTAGQPAVLVGPQGLVLLVGNIGFDDDPVRTGTPFDGPAWQGDDLEIAVRFERLSELIQKVMEPPEDAFFHADRMEKVWYRKKRVLGIRVRNRADIEDFNGVLDIRNAWLAVEEGCMFMELDIEGQFEGRLQGRAYGLSLNAPFRAIPTLRDTLPVQVRTDDEGLILAYDQRELTIALEIETWLARRKIGFTWPLTLSSEKLLRPVRVPNWYHRKVDVPVKVARRKVIETRPVVF